MLILNFLFISFLLVTCFKSILFKQIIIFFPFSSSTISQSLLSICVFPSITSITSSDFEIYSKLFFTPIFSIIFFDFLMPAVSTIIKGIPSMYNISSTASLVVPGICVTMALSFLASTFNRLDLPTFGLPTIATFIPFLIISPLFSSLISTSMLFLISITFFSSTSYGVISKSSSIKSIDASNSIITSNILFLNSSILSFTIPFMLFAATFKLCSVFDLINSITASA